MRVSVTALLLATCLVAATGASVAVRAASNDSVPAVKDQSRMPADTRRTAGNDYSGALVQLAQAARPPMPPGPARMPLEGGVDAQGPRGPMEPGGEPFRGPPPTAMRGHGPFGPVPPNRAACEEDINRHAAMTGYIKSKLQLQGSQKDAWRKIEEAAEPAVEKLRQACALLPVNAGPPPRLPDGLEIAGKQLAARAAFLLAVSGPAHALYETLSPDQRAALVPPPPPPRPL
jgi:hypothetical protein